MTINGLENNYYLTQNDIWIKINGFTEVVSKVVIDFKNLTTGKELNGFECSASPDNDCFFNVCFAIRALMPEPDQSSINSLQNFQIKITAKFRNIALPDEVSTVTKYFIRGGRDKLGVNEWHLNDGDYLVDNYWISGGSDWNVGENVPIINNNLIVDDPGYSKITRQDGAKKCDGIVVKYLNSLGAYQYFYFDRYELKNKTKAGKTVNRIASRLRNYQFQNTGYEEAKTMTLYSFTEKKLQSNFEDLIRSVQLFYFDAKGDDTASQWHLFKLDDNTSVWNNYENYFENKLEFTLPNYRNIQI